MKWYIVIFVLILVALLAIQQYLIHTTPVKEDVLLEKINKIEHKLDSISSKKDSIRTIIDSTHVKIITNEKHFQEKVNIIISQPYSSDSSYVTNYIRQFANKDTMYNLK